MDKYSGEEKLTELLNSFRYHCNGRKTQKIALLPFFGYFYILKVPEMLAVKKNSEYSNVELSTLCSCKVQQPILVPHSLYVQ